MNSYFPNTDATDRAENLRAVESCDAYYELLSPLSPSDDADTLELDV